METAKKNDRCPICFSETELHDQEDVIVISCVSCSFDSIYGDKEKK